VRFGHSQLLTPKQKDKIRSKQILEGPPAVSSIKVQSVMREKVLSEAFKNTWVSAGMDKFFTNAGVAANLKESDFAFDKKGIEERAEKWLEE